MYARALTFYSAVLDIKWSPQLLAVMGAMCVLALPPFNFFLILPLCFLPLCQCLDQTETAKQAFMKGWAFGVGFFIAGMYWLATAFVVAGVGHLSFLGAIILPSLLALFIGVVTLTAWLVGKKPLDRALLIALGWAVCEWLRGHILTGLPWNFLGYGCDLATLQTAAHIGIYGLSALIVLWAVLALQVRHLFIMGIAWAGLVLLFVAGQMRLNANPTQETAVNLRLVQPCISQVLKWDRTHLEETIMRQVALSQLRAERPLNAIIWAEASVPLFIEKHAAVRKILAESVLPGTLLIFGAPREEGREGGSPPIHSSLMAMNAAGEILTHYDKSHLVPFGEYFPYRAWFPTISKLTYGDKDYAPGRGIETLTLPNIPAFSPLICYEAIFPGEVAKTERRPEWLLNITNDAWYGSFSGPQQHLQITRVRSIEEGLPLVRVANNGISAVIDPLGRIITSLELNAIGILDAILPKPLQEVPLYARYKDLFFWIIILSECFLIFLIRRKEYTNDIT